MFLFVVLYLLVGVAVFFCVFMAYAWMSGLMYDHKCSWYLIPLWALYEEFKLHVPGGINHKAEFIRKEIARSPLVGGHISGRRHHWNVSDVEEAGLHRECAIDYFDPPHWIWIVVLGTIFFWPLVLVLLCLLYRSIEDPTYLL